MISPAELRGMMVKREAGYRRLAVKLKKFNKRTLDDKVHGLHNAFFAKYDCLSCGNCCRSLGPRITTTDIERLARRLKLKAGSFTEQYLRIDEDGDFVFKTMPCPFLGSDNYCSVYDARPRACREYPHTDRVNFYQIIDLSLKNAGVCPVVYEIFSTLQQTES